MKESKYYTPSIKEFHIGFEFEELFYTGSDIVVDGDSKKIVARNEWFKREIKSLNWIITREYVNTRTRVKYLDKEDIESLGFKQTVEDQYVLDDIYLLIDDDSFVQIIVDNGFLFQGTIKNRSELKKILKMLGYDWNK